MFLLCSIRIWAVVGGVVKNFMLTPDYVLWRMSYDNIIMYSAVLPSYDPDGKTEDKELDFEDLEDELR